MNEPTSNTELGRALFNAFESGDEPAVREICHPQLSVRQNKNPEMDLDTLVQFSMTVKKLVPGLHYENITCTATSEGFVEEHDVCGTLPDGSDFLIRACVVATVENGKVTSLREYLDSAAAQGLLAALSQ